MAPTRTLKMHNLTIRLEPTKSKKRKDLLVFGYMLGVGVFARIESTMRLAKVLADYIVFNL